MDCHQARHRLTDLLSLDSVSGAADDLELHLASCSECRRLWEATVHLKRAFDQTTTEFDTTDLPSFAEVKRTLQEASGPKTWRGFQSMSDFWRYGSGRARWSAGILAFAAVLAFFTLVPFQYDKTVGYEVALAGVDPALAHNEDRLRSLLSKLGAENAKVEWLHCDSTCELKISDLAELKQCQLLVCAMKELGPVEVLEDGAAICKRASGPILELARSRMLAGDAASIPDEEVRQMLTRCLGENLECKTLLQSKAGTCVQDSGRLCVVAVCVDSQSCSLAGGKACGAALKAQCGAGACGMTCPRMASGTNGEAVAGPDPIANPAYKQTALVPGKFQLAQNQPNPFNPSTDIEFALPASAQVRLEVFNTLGRKVRTLLDGTLAPGLHKVAWDARSDQGDRVPSGTYLYRLTAGEETQSRTMTLLK
jgi:hypothetical protein